jgi:hypothetical protein
MRNYAIKRNDLRFALERREKMTERVESAASMVYPT